MRRKGFEPSQALSHQVLSLARLTTPASPHKNMQICKFKSYSIRNFEQL